VFVRLWITGLTIFGSTRCSKCERNVEHADDLCANPEKYDKSSKAMESMGSVKTVLDIWRDCPNAYVAAIVTDEDSTTRSKLSHCLLEMVAAGRMTEADRRYPPEKEGNLGRMKPDKGELPMDHPIIIKHSDPIHFVKNYKGELFVLVYLPKGKSETCKADALRLSRNLAYMLKQQIAKENCTFEDFMKAGEASFEHHWNNHEHCGDWCQALSWTAEEKEAKKGKFRDKEKNPKEYAQQLKVKEKYLSATRMRRCFHDFCNNKTEQLHGFVVNVFLPKRSYFCRTICGRARTYLATSVDSLGFEGYYKELFAELGITMTDETELYFQQHDRSRKTDKEYAEKPERKKKRAKRKLEQIQKAWTTEVEDKANGHTYRSRMAVPTTTGSQVGTNEGAGGSSTPFCKACGNYGHQRRSNKNCTQNPSNKHYRGTYVESVRKVVSCVVCKYSYCASVNVSTHLSYNFYV
jgi:hypothetical protein